MASRFFGSHFFSFISAVCILAAIRTIAFIDSIFAKVGGILPRLGDEQPLIPHRLAYAGPTVDLRHEAHTSRRSAARNV